MQRSLFRLALGAFLLLLTTNAAVQSHAQLPPQSNAYGHSLSQWMEKYVTWLLNGATGPDTVGKVRFMPFPSGNYTGGSFTPEDPGILEGHLDLDWKVGTPFVLPIQFWYGETYLPGTPVAVNPDPEFPISMFENAYVKVTIDGKTIISNADKMGYYVPPTYFPDPIVYPAPSSYGSIAANFFQGFCFVHQPLSKGTHTMTLEASSIIPAGDYINIPGGYGVFFKNTWTLTVK